MLYLLIILVVILLLKNNNLSIKWKTFKEKGAKAQTGDFGVYCYNGSQGKGKTYSLTEYCYDNNDLIIYSNYPFNEEQIKLLHNNEYHFYNGFKGLLEIKNNLDDGKIIIPEDKQLVIIYDELFSELMRGDKLSKGILDFLSQMRKRKIIFLTSAQYWSEIPITFRRFVRYQIDCNFLTFPVIPFSLLIKTFHDGEEIKWDETEQDFVSPIIVKTITKVRQAVFNSYDTFFRVRVLPLEHSRKNEQIFEKAGEFSQLEKSKKIDKDLKYDDHLHTTTKANGWSMVKQNKKIDKDFWKDLNEDDYEK